jgi:hypothetical protein
MDNKVEESVMDQLSENDLIHFCTTCSKIVPVYFPQCFWGGNNPVCCKAPQEGISREPSGVLLSQAAGYGVH